MWVKACSNPPFGARTSLLHRVSGAAPDEIRSLDHSPRTSSARQKSGHVLPDFCAASRRLRAGETSRFRWGSAPYPGGRSAAALVLTALRAGRTRMFGVVSAGRAGALLEPSGEGRAHQ